MPNFGHEKSAIMKRIFKQAEPGNYTPINNDYIKRLHRGEVPQLTPNLGRLTNQLYSSIGSTSTIIYESGNLNTERLPQFMYTSKKNRLYNSNGKEYQATQQY